MHPAGIFRDVAADRARDLARRVRRVIKAGTIRRKAWTISARRCRTPSSGADISIKAFRPI